MQKTIITCDHCGKECNSKNEAKLCGDAVRKGAQYYPDTIHACSREHLGFALAKAFGIPIDGVLLERLDKALLERNAASREVEGLQKDLAHYKATLAARDARLESAEKALNEGALQYGRALHRIEELELLAQQNAITTLLLQNASACIEQLIPFAPSVEPLSRDSLRRFLGEISAHLATVTEDATEPQEQPEKPKAFDEGLVERLVQLVRNMSPFRERHTYNEVADIVRAILSDLAAVLVEMPNANDVFNAWHAVGNIDAERDGMKHGAGVVGMLRARIGPVLAAKEARIAELEQRGERIVELELANEASRQRIAELEKRLAQTPVDATGKTPGHVFRDLVRSYTGVLPEHAPTWDGLRFTAQDDWEQAAKAFLRAFGGAEALRRVRKSIRESLPAARDAGSVWKIEEDRVYAIIDDEIASITDTKRPTKPGET